MIAIEALGLRVVSGTGGLYAKIGQLEAEKKTENSAYEVIVRIC